MKLKIHQSLWRHETFTITITVKNSQSSYSQEQSSNYTYETSCITCAVFEELKWVLHCVLKCVNVAELFKICDSIKVQKRKILKITCTLNSYFWQWNIERKRGHKIMKNLSKLCSKPFVWINKEAMIMQSIYRI